MRTSVLAAAMAASLTVGGAAGAALFVPAVSGAQTDDPSADESPSRAREHPERGEFLADALTPLVENGTIDQSQADAVIAAIEEARPDGFVRHGHRGGGLFGPDLREVLGMSAGDLRAALEEGRTIAEIAEAAGIPIDEVVDALVAGAEERLGTAVENGWLTEEEAAEKLADLESRIDDLVNGELELGDHRRHRGGGPFAGHGDADTETDDTTGS